MANDVAFYDGKPGAWEATSPDAPGCTAMGADLAGLYVNAVAALREWMEDRVRDGFALPQPRGAEDIGEAEREGRMTNLIPLLLDKGRSVRANISIDAGLPEQIDEAAKLRGLTRSAFLASAAREKIAHQR